MRHHPKSPTGNGQARGAPCELDPAQIDSAIRRGVAAWARRDKQPEDALALAFAARYGDELRYVSFWGKWLKWTAGKWQAEKTAGFSE